VRFFKSRLEILKISAGIALLKFSASENREGCIFTGCTTEYKMRYFDEGDQDIMYVTYP